MLQPQRLDSFDYVDLSDSMADVSVNYKLSSRFAQICIQVIRECKCSTGK